MADRPLQFELIGQHSDSFRGAVAALWEIEPPIHPLTLSRSRAWPREPGPVPALFSSFLFHFSLAFFLISVPLSLLLEVPPRAPTESRNTPAPAVYDLTKLNLADYLPAELSPGPGGIPGSGSADGRPTRGTTSQDLRVAIVSNPTQPDNNRQTIVQTASPADLKVPETRLPNLVVVNVAPAPQATPKSGPSAAGLKLTLPDAFPALPSAPPVTPTVMLLAVVPVVSAPQLETHVELPPYAPPPQPLKPERHAPATVPSLPAPAAPTTTASKVALPATPAPAAHVESAAHPPSRETLTSLSTDPIRIQDLMTLLPGNRQGAFFITPLDVGPGSPGGLLRGEAAAGKTGNGTGGDASVAVGEENSGGAGPGAPDASAVISISGAATASDAAGGSLPPPDRLIYPVDIAALRLRRSGFVVSAGPGGGGGLPAYGVLHGHRIYTIYLPMPGKNWILQFCVLNDHPPAVLPSQTFEIHMEAPLMPPTAIDQFDFHRLPLAGDNAGRLIVLSGVIQQDGSVANLRVLQAVAPQSDKAAAAAFRQWKFAPAMRAGNPVAVEVLVGIPASVPSAE